MMSTTAAARLPVPLARARHTINGVRLSSHARNQHQAILLNEQKT
jgi:hypothetical protein